jgi:hypothetical protein
MSTPSAARIDDGLLHTSIFAEIASTVIEMAITFAVDALAIGLVALAAGVEVCTLGFGTVLAIGIVVGAVMLVTGASAKVHEFAQWAGNKMFPPGIEANISTGSKNVSINSKRAARAAFIMVPVSVEASEPPEAPDISLLDSMSQILSEMWRPTIASAAPGTAPVDYDRILCKKHPSPILPNVIDTTVAGGESEADAKPAPVAAAEPVTEPDLSPPSFLTLSTLEGLKRGVTGEEAARRGALTRAVTLPAVAGSLGAVAAAPVGLAAGEAAGIAGAAVGKKAVEVATSKKAREVAVTVMQATAQVEKYMGVQPGLASAAPASAGAITRAATEAAKNAAMNRGVPAVIRPGLPK